MDEAIPTSVSDGVVSIRRLEEDDLDLDLEAKDDAQSRYVAYVDCDLANDHVPPGEANISYSAHPAHRGNGYVSRAVRLVMSFLVVHTSAPRAHLLVDADNIGSLRVAAAVGAVEVERWTTARGRTMIRHVLEL